MKKIFADKIIKSTIDGYNKIAEKFSQTRRFLSEDIIYLKKYLVESDYVLDVGCGNGRLSEIVKTKRYVGVDTSDKLIDIAKKKYPKSEFISTKTFVLPFKKNSFDKVFCLSVLHHIPSVMYRKKLLSEIRRVLNPKGKLIISVWDLFASTKYQAKIRLANSRKDLNDLGLDKNDIFLSFEDPERKLKIQRYLHCFTVDELSSLLIKSKFKIEHIETINRNKNGDLANILALVF